MNEGTYGKALAQYLEAQLKSRSYDAACIGCEDWGWWLELRGQPFVMGVCVYGSPDLPKTHELCVSICPEPGRYWSWRQFRFVDMTSPVTKLFADLREISSTTLRSRCWVTLKNFRWGNKQSGRALDKERSPFVVCLWRRKG